LTKAELRPTTAKGCAGIKPGDTIEVHWVHSSCAIKPGKGLGSCLSKTCKNPVLRVEAQVFVVVNDASAADFSAYAYDPRTAQKLHQAKALPKGTGKPVVFHGSTTGPSYTQQKCSPFKVTWSVRPQCAKIHIDTLHAWCRGNVFKEKYAHGVRELVTAPGLLAPIP